MHKEYQIFDLEELYETECVMDFRFKKHEIPILGMALGLPEHFRCKQGTVCDRIEALCITLRRFTYPCRYSDLVPTFGRSVPELSMITSTVVDYIYEMHNDRITTWNHQLLSPENLQTYANAIHEKGAALDNCFGFVDGTVRRICRPGEMQRLVYNGHKRVHALKFQFLSLPNGIIANIFGPIGMLFKYHKLVDYKYSIEPQEPYLFKPSVCGGVIQDFDLLEKGFAKLSVKILQSPYNFIVLAMLYCVCVSSFCLFYVTVYLSPTTVHVLTVTKLLQKCLFSFLHIYHFIFQKERCTILLC